MKLSLNNIQQAFMDALFNQNEDVLPYIKASSDLCGKKRLSIYKNSILSSRQKILKNIYPVCEKLVGIDFFNEMANQYFYLDTQCLNHYGHHFAEFMLNFEPLQSLPYLPDVARLEWAFHTIHTCDDDFCDKKLEFYEKSIYRLPKGSYLMSSLYPVHLIWEMNQDSHLQYSTLEMIQDNFYYFIFRHHFDKKILLINYEDWLILHWVQEQMTFQELCHRMIENFPDMDILEKFIYLFKHFFIKND